LEKHLHIVCLDTPYPPDYGGAFEMFYTIRWLYESGVKLYLHCFEYGRGRQPELERYATWVYYYQRKEGAQSISLKTPYIVQSRKNTDLLNNLQRDRHPILFEGIHSTYFLVSGELKNRKMFVRSHNVEWIYYREMAKATDSIPRKLYFTAESILLKQFEKKVAAKAPILAISEPDATAYRNMQADVKFLPAFTAWDQVQCQEGMGSFCLYHGNLSVPENEKAAAWLIKEVFSNIEIPLVIAGRRPPARLVKLALRNRNCCMVEDPSGAELDDLVRKAHIHVLPAMNDTGIKLKLLHALFCGRHCIVNERMVKGTGLEAACRMAIDATAFQQTVSELYKVPFTKADIAKRQWVLEKDYHNEKNVRQLITWIW